MTCIAVFSTVAGIGNTTLVYHLGHILANQGRNVLLVDCDPQATLTSLCLPEERVEALWYGNPGQRPTIASSGFDATLHIEPLGPNLALVPGDTALALLEHALAASWIDALKDQEDSVIKFSYLAHQIEVAARSHNAAIVLLDLGPSLGAINRAVLLAADFVLTPVTPSFQSIEGLQALGETLQEWRNLWQPIYCNRPEEEPLAGGSMLPLGYVVSQTGMRLSSPIHSYARWLDRLPGAYRQAMHSGTGYPKSIADDPECLGLIHHYAGLMPLALDAREPMFDLRPADGAIGSHMDSVLRCRQDFERLAQQILTRISS